jgi:hypothetical protein
LPNPIRFLFRRTTRELGKGDFAFAAAHTKSRVRRRTQNSLFRPKACLAMGACDDVHKSMLLHVLPRGAKRSTEDAMGRRRGIWSRVWSPRVSSPLMHTLSFCLEIGLPLMLL